MPSSSRRLFASIKTLPPSGASKTEAPCRGAASHPNVYSNPEQPPPLTPTRSALSPWLRVMSILRMCFAARSVIRIILPPHRQGCAVRLVGPGDICDRDRLEHRDDSFSYLPERISNRARSELLTSHVSG